MGLTTCPKCGKTISERAITCPHCKSEFSKSHLIICEDCQKEYSTSMAACPNCGCPNSFAKQKTKKQKGIILSAIAITLLTIIVLSIISISKKKNELEYYENMETITYAMLDGAANAENTGNLIISVWYNAIHEKHDNETNQYTMKDGKFVDDFNDALSRLFENEDFRSSIDEIENDQADVTELMKLLKNPPKKYEEAYRMLKSYYNNYLKLTNAVINPTGSLNTFSEDFNTYDNNLVESYKKMKLYLD